MKKLLFTFLSIATISLAGCNEKPTKYEDESHNVTAEINELISDYIIETYASSSNETDQQFEVHKIYGTSESKGVLSVYLYSYYGGFNKSTRIELQTGHSLPAVIKLKRIEGQYKVIDYTEPKDGSLYSSSLKKMFPEKYINQISHDTSNIGDLEEEMARKVEQWLAE